jgi:hypothetical protein
MVSLPHKWTQRVCYWFLEVRGSGLIKLNRMESTLDSGFLNHSAQRTQRRIFLFLCRRPTLNLYNPIGHPVLAEKPRDPAGQASGREKTNSVPSVTYGRKGVTVKRFSNLTPKSALGSYISHGPTQKDTDWNPDKRGK